MKVRDFLTNGLTVVVISGLLAFAIAQFVKTRQGAAVHQMQGRQIQWQSKQLKVQKIRNSMLKIRIRSLENDKKSNDKLVRQRMGLMRSNEVRVAPGEL